MTQVYREFMADRVYTSPGSVGASTATGVTIASTACNLGTISSIDAGAYPVIGWAIEPTTTTLGNIAAYLWGGSSTTCNANVSAGGRLNWDTCPVRDPTKVWLVTQASACSNVVVHYFCRDESKVV